MTKIAIVCGSFHKDEIERMLEYAKDQASKDSLTTVSYTHLTLPTILLV